MSEKISVLVIKSFEEDTFKRVFFKVFMSEPVVISATKLIEIKVPNSCCGCPLRKGQMIKLSHNSDALEIDKYSDITYNASSNQWEITLPTWYVSNPIKSMRSNGFSEYSVISGDVLRFLKDGAQ